MNKILDHINILICRFSEWIVAGVSYVFYQAGIPFEMNILLINPYLASFFHGLVSMMVPVGSYFIIHISKELLKDKESWMSIAFTNAVYVSSFKWLKRNENRNRNI